METRTMPPKFILTVINQLYEMEQKVRQQGDFAHLQRNIDKMKDAFLNIGSDGTGVEQGVAYEDPMGQSFNETRTDMEASIAGAGTDNLVVVQVIKPIIRVVSRGRTGDFSNIIQKGIVIVETRKEPSR